MSITAISRRIIRQFLRDPRSLALIFLAPMVILLLTNIMLKEDAYKPVIGLHNAHPAVASSLEAQGLYVYEYTETEALEALETRHIHAYMSMAASEPIIILEGTDAMMNQASLQALQLALTELSPVSPPSILIKYLYGFGDMRLFDQIGPILIGLLVFFFVFLLAGVSFLRERITGTLERFLATPVKRYEIVLGYIGGFGLFAAAQTFLISIFAVHGLGMMMAGRFLHLMIINFLLAMTAMTLGILLSTYANNELQVVQFIPIVIVPQFFFSGIFSLESMPQGIRHLSRIMPIRYGADALREVMIRGKGLERISPNLLYLVGFSVLFAVLNTLALKKHRQI